MKSAQLHVVLCSIVAALSCSGCSAKPQEPAKRMAETAQTVKGISSATVASGAIADTLEVVGTVRARTSAVVSARIPGTISMLRVREGERVRKGQLLAQLDSQENQASAAMAAAGIDEAQRAVDEALARRNLADTTYERYQKLLSEQAVSRQEFDVKQSERDVAAQSVARSEARLRQAREGARAATAMADYTRISAPIAGIITVRQAALGATVFPAQPLMTIEDEGSYQLELAIPESMALKVKPGAAVQVILDAEGSSFAAQISELVPAADPGSRTFIAKINLNRTGLKSGLFGRGTLTLGSSTSGMLVAKKAINERGALTSVWTLDKDSIARLRLVKTGKSIGDKVEILSGLSDGERIVISGGEKVSEGSKVE